MNAHPHPSRPNSFRLCVEALEDRVVPTVGPPVDGVLTITGNWFVNELSIVQDDTDNNIHVSMRYAPWLAPDEYDFASSAVHTIVVDLKEGGDDFYYGLALGTDLTRGKTLDIDLGEGHNDATFDCYLAGSSLSADLTIDLSCGSGEDELWANFGGITGSLFWKNILDMDVELGGGDDTAEVGIRGDLGGNGEAWVKLWGGDGDDWLYVHGVGTDIAAGGRLYVDARGEVGEDQIVIDYAGKVVGNLYVYSRGGDQGDTLLTYAQLLNGSTGNVYTYSWGDAGHDYLEMKVWGTTTGSHSHWFSGGLGYDTAMKTSNVSSASTESVTTV